jgi:NAD(P)-dependent dehydrogenase (short-subunit alcohol dehydrogenase family)
MLYGTTKATLNRLSAGIAAELDGTGVCCNEFGPFSIVWTPGTAMTGVEKYRGLPGWVEEPVEGMAETALALASCDPNAVNGLTVYSTTYLQEIGREIHTLDGKDVLRNWKPAVD